MVKNKKEKKTSRELQKEGFENAFIREVNEDVQQDRLNDVLKKYGTKIAVVCAVIILFVVGHTVYTNLHNKNVMKEAGEFQKVVNEVDSLLISKDIAGAKVLVRGFLEDAKYDYKDIAYTMLFELSLKDGSDMLSLLNEIEDGANTDKIRDFAAFNYAIIEFEKKSDLGILIEKLSPLLKNRKSVFNESSYLLVISSALRVGDVEMAKRFISDLERKRDLSDNVKSQLEGLKKLVENKG